jgi:dTDP-4-amino-4,6-dideoxygalactose transaminase
MERLRAKGVACQAYFPAIHAQPYLASLECCHPPEPLVHTATASESCLALPFSSKLKPEQIAYVCATLVDALRELARPAAQAA